MWLAYICNIFDAAFPFVGVPCAGMSQDGTRNPGRCARCQVGGVLVERFLTVSHVSALPFGCAVRQLLPCACMYRLYGATTQTTDWARGGVAMANRVVLVRPQMVCGRAPRSKGVATSTSFDYILSLAVASGTGQKGRNHFPDESVPFAGAHTVHASWLSS